MQQRTMTASALAQLRQQMDMYARTGNAAIFCKLTMVYADVVRGLVSDENASDTLSGPATKLASELDDIAKQIFDMQIHVYTAHIIVNARIDDFALEVLGPYVQERYGVVMNPSLMFKAPMGKA
jgi:hypothetical protein